MDTSFLRPTKSNRPDDGGWEPSFGTSGAQRRALGVLGEAAARMDDAAVRSKAAAAEVWAMSTRSIGSSAGQSVQSTPRTRIITPTQSSSGCNGCNEGIPELVSGSGLLDSKPVGRGLAASSMRSGPQVSHDLKEPEAEASPEKLRISGPSPVCSGGLGDRFANINNSGAEREVAAASMVTSAGGTAGLLGIGFSGSTAPGIHIGSGCVVAGGCSLEGVAGHRGASISNVSNIATAPADSADSSAGVPMKMAPAAAVPTAGGDAQTHNACSSNNNNNNHNNNPGPVPVGSSEGSFRLGASPMLFAARARTPSLTQEERGNLVKRMRARRHLEDALQEGQRSLVLEAAVRLAREANCSPERVRAAQQQLALVKELEESSSIIDNSTRLREVLLAATRGGLSAHVAAVRERLPAEATQFLDEASPLGASMNGTFSTSSNTASSVFTGTSAAASSSSSFPMASAAAKNVETRRPNPPQQDLEAQRARELAAAQAEQRQRQERIVYASRLAAENRLKVAVDLAALQVAIDAAKSVGLSESIIAPYQDALEEGHATWAALTEAFANFDGDAVEHWLEVAKGTKLNGPKLASCHRALKWLRRFDGLRLQSPLKADADIQELTRLPESLAEMREMIPEGRCLVLPLGLDRFWEVVEKETAKMASLAALSTAVLSAQELKFDVEVLDRLLAATRALKAATKEAMDSGLQESDMAFAESIRRKVHSCIQDRLGAIRVFCRVRPLSSNEISMGMEPAVRCTDLFTVELAPSALDTTSVSAISAAAAAASAAASSAGAGPPTSASRRLSKSLTMGVPGISSFPTFLGSSGSRPGSSPGTPRGGVGTPREDRREDTFNFFDACWAPGSQEQVFDNVRELIQSAVDGQNLTIFTYGQTGAGKTYTMYGKGDSAPSAGPRRASFRGGSSPSFSPMPRPAPRIGTVNPIRLRSGSKQGSGLECLRDQPRDSPKTSARDSTTSGASSPRLPLETAPTPVGTSNSTCVGTDAGHEDAGICTRAANELFRLLHQSEAHFIFSVTFSMVELYCQRYIDLLDPHTEKTLKQRKTTEGEVYLENVLEEAVRTPDDIRCLMKIGARERHQRETACNAESSRSHTVCIVKLFSESRETGLKRSSKMLLVDLAGSERVKRSDVAGTGMREAIEVNRSLSALGDVLVAIQRGEQHIPYRNHELTQLMQDSIGGSAKTLMFLNVSPAPCHLDETRVSLEFAQRIKSVMNKPCAASRTGGSAGLLMGSSGAGGRAGLGIGPGAAVKRLSNNVGGVSSTFNSSPRVVRGNSASGRRSLMRHATVS